MIKGCMAICSLTNCLCISWLPPRQRSIHMVVSARITGHRLSNAECLPDPALSRQEPPVYGKTHDESKPSKPREAELFSLAGRYTPARSVPNYRQVPQLFASALHSINSIIDP